MKKVFILFVFLLFKYQFVSSKDLPFTGADKTQPPPTPAGSATKATTVAGGNGQGSDANQLDSPQGLYVDEAGNIYISDTYNNRIQKWTPGASTGETIAGGNGKGSAANQLNRPSEIFVDRSGNLFIADQYNHRIQMWTKGASSGVTVAGGHGRGAAANQLSLPFDVVVDKLGDIYISDTENDRIQRWSPGADSGVTVAGGTGRGSTAYKLDHPKGLIVEDSHNNYRSLHIADYNNGRVLYWPVGVDHGATEAGGKVPGSDLIQLQHPEGIMLDPSRRLVVVDQANNRIQRWTIMPARGTATNVAGGNGEGATPGTLSSPSGVFVDPVGNIYVSDKKNHRVQKFGLPDNGPYLAMGIVAAGGIPLGSDLKNPRTLYYPQAVVVDRQGNLLVADYGNGRVQKWAPGDTSGTTITSVGSNGQNNSWDTGLSPKALALDSAENLYVLSRETVMKYSKGSAVGTAVAGRGRCCFVTDSSLTNPLDMFVDWKGVVYVVDNEGSRVVKWLPGARYGVVVARATGKINDYRDYKFRAITGDVSGNIYVADSKSSVNKFAPGDSVGVVVATAWGAGQEDINLDQVTGMYLDAAGDLYISEQYTSTILKWRVGAKSGIVVAGGVPNYWGNYNVEPNRIKDPRKIFVDSLHNIYLAEGNMNRVLKFVPREPTACPNNIYIKSLSCDDGVVVRWKAPAAVFPSNVYIPLNKDPRGGTMKFMGSFNGHGYYKSERTYSWLVAAALAGTIGDTSVAGYLASITSAGENDFIFNKIKDGPNAPWIGLFNTGFPGMFHWVDNTPILFTNWIPGEPNNAGGSVFNMKEPYVRMSNLNGKWNDQRDDNFQFVSEFNSPVDIYKQVSGPANGATLKPGVYTVCYEKTNAVSKSKDTCCFNIVVSCSSQAFVQSADNAESSIAAEELVPNQLKAMISPNPTKTYFKLQISSSDNKNNVSVKVSDLQGRKVELQNNIKPGSRIELGKNLRPGIYFVELKQGTQTIVEKVIKQ